MLNKSACSYIYGSKYSLYMKLFLPILATLIFVSCNSESEQIAKITAPQYSAELTELSDEEYPDNPDVMVRHTKYVETEMNSIELFPNGENFDFVFIPNNATDDTVRMNNIAVMEFIPTVPNYAKGDDYMSLISIVNQEWNRNQVKWVGEDLAKVTPTDFVVNGEKITRIDIARNCLNAYLWELFFYSKEDGKDKVFYHGWFEFPRELYAELFDKRNHEKFEAYAAYLENWKNPPSEEIDLSKIRVENAGRTELTFKDRSDEMYPLEGERKKKKIAIIYPETFTKMSDFHTDSATFATFSQPGFYNRQDPRHTELGRFKKLIKVEKLSTVVEGVENAFDEYSFLFERENGEQTLFIIGGIKTSSLPQLKVEDANSGTQFPMGIGNHPFYEDCNAHEHCCTKNNPYFGLLLDAEGKWLDSHTIGIDGPLLHLDAENPNILHVWLLSFERHALVGHYELDLVE